MTGVRVHLVRHGAHAVVGEKLCGRLAGFSLSDVGRCDAEAAARRLGAEAPGAVYTSPTTRARETAQIIAETFELQPILDDAIDEIDFGEWAGRTFVELDGDARWRCWNADRGRERAPGGESMAEAQVRVAGWLDRVRDAHPDGTIAAVSHADVIKAAIAYVLGLPLHFHDRFDIAPGSLTTLVHGGAGWRVVSLNEVPHV